MLPLRELLIGLNRRGWIVISDSCRVCVLRAGNDADDSGVTLECWCHTTGTQSEAVDALSGGGL